MVVLAIKLIGMSSLLAIPAYGADAEPAARAISVAGNVLIRKAKQTEQQGRALRSGEAIFSDDVIKTASGASLKLLFTDKTVLDLGPGSQLNVNEYKLKDKDGSDREVTMSLDYGKIRASVNTPVGTKGKFLIRTKTTTMGVRGTEFVVAADAVTGPAGKDGKPNQTVKTEITVVHGKVEVRDSASPMSAPVALTAGKQLVSTAAMNGDRVLQRSSASDGPKVVELSSSQVKAVVSEAKVEDHTFKQAVVIENSGSSSGNSGNGPQQQQGGGSMTIAAIRETVSADNKPGAGPSNDSGGARPPKPPGFFEAGTTPLAPPPPALQGQPIRLTVVLQR